MKISDVAKMPGLPVETIRFYEKEGIVSPERNDNSGYREYSLWDVFKLVACMEYRSGNDDSHHLRALLLPEAAERHHGHDCRTEDQQQHGSGQRER